MQKTVLNEIYELLRTHGLVRSESEFSREWLGRSDCYMRTLRFKGTEPSVGSIAICASKLQHYGKRLAEKKSQSQLSGDFLRMSQECHLHINARAEMTWQKRPEWV
ncbi:hypothetical protein IMCC20628_00495 [Hoeflea sp. IMCC20628]|uniref:DUF6626 family protein n=1 Tax=Hoeflea sp. IMCC20628 TaxID=1620421 RepID=UPI00063AAB04|nr:DUF6626 family protein [Hoeflea sp. IMCC20628]AKH99219.1 hypothetical protein IMCC20628_00495 [Hoeflea sp. IMCC20628]